MVSSSAEGIYAETLAVFDRSDHRYEPLTTPEVADALDANRRTVYKRLRKLVDRGELETKATGSNSRVWWRPPARSATSTAASAAGGTTDRARPGGSDREDTLRRHNERMAKLVKKHEVAETRYQSLFENCPVVLWEQDRSAVKDRLEALEREVDDLETHLHNNRDVVVSLIEAIDFIDVNENALEYYGVDSKEALFENFEALLTEKSYENFATVFVKMANGEMTFSLETEFQTVHGQTRDELVHVAVPDAYAEDWSRMFISTTDITEQKERQRELKRMRDFFREAERMGDIGVWELDENGDIFWTEGAKRIHEIDDSYELTVESAFEFVHPEDRPRVKRIFEDALETGEPYDMELRIVTAEGNERWVHNHGKPVGGDGKRQTFWGLLQDITERRERERKLERQREQLAALNELNNVVRGITEVVSEQSTREEIEQVVCERLAASESYMFAWVAMGDSPARLQSRSECGIEGPLEDGSLPFDPSETSPVERALETREIQVSRTPSDGSDWGTLSQDTGEHGFRSVAAIPIVHRGTLYGVIGVHSERSDAFAKEEREVIGQIGEVVGHAIAALDRKRALLSEEMLELTIRNPDLLESREGHGQSHGTIAFDRQIPLGDGTYLLYGTAPADAMEVLHAMCDQQSHWVGVQVIDESENEVRFELETANPPVASTVADHGGYLENARIRDGEFVATVYLAPGTDVRPLVEQIWETTPNFEVTSQQQVTREDPLQRHLLENVSERLTEKQQTALEVAYYGGFFEWPRDMSGEEIAESLDIGASTFHHHVRKAERKILDVVFTE